MAHGPPRRIAFWSSFSRVTEKSIWGCGANGTSTESLGNISDLAPPSAGWSWHEVGKMCLKTAQAMVAQHWSTYILLFQNFTSLQNRKQSVKSYTMPVHHQSQIYSKCGVYEFLGTNMHQLPSWPMGPAQDSKTWVTLSTVQPSLAKTSNKSCMGRLFGQNIENSHHEMDFL